MTPGDSRLLRLCVASGLLTEGAASAAEREAAGRGVPLRVALLRAGMPPEALSSLEQAAGSAAGPAGSPADTILAADAPVVGSVVVGSGSATRASGGAVPGPSATLRHIGKYEILGELGHGGMGIVYRARHPGLDRVVALKTLLAAGSDESTERFLREARTAARLGKHPNLVQIHDVDEADGTPFIIMDCVEGRSFEREIRDAPPTPRRAAEVVEAIARGLAVAHAQGVIHRDLKPANVLVGRDGVPLVTDFGLAKDVAAPGLSEIGQVLGTPAYLSPEQAEGRPGRIDARTDVYGLGTILYEALAGREAFRAEGVVELLRKVCEEDPAPPSAWKAGVPRELDIVALKCLAKRREDRYASATELADDLARWLRGEGILARPLPFPVRLARKARRHAVALGLAAAALALAPWGAVAGVRAWREAAERRRFAEKTESERVAREQVAAKAAQLLRDGRDRLQLAERSLRIEPEDDKAALSTLERFETAAELLAGSIALAPRNAEARRLRARALRTIGRFGESQAEARSALEIEPGNLDALFELVSSELMELRASRGVMQVLDFSSSDQLRGLSVTAIYSPEPGNTSALEASARADLALLEKAGPDDARTRYCRGSMRTVDGDLPGALAELEAAIAADRLFLEAHELRATLLSYLGRPESLEAFRLLTKTFPRKVDYQMKLSQMEPDLRDALAALDRADLLLPNNSDLRGARILAYVNHDSLEDGWRLALQSKGLSSSRTYLYNTSALAAFKVGDWAFAAECLDRWEAATPNTVFQWFFRGGMLHGAGREEEALEAFRKARTLTADHPVFRWVVGRQLALLGRYGDSAKEMLEAVAAGDLDDRTRKALETQGAVIRKRASEITKPGDAAALVAGIAAMLRLFVAPDAAEDRRKQFEGSIRTLNALACELYEQAGEWKKARDLSPALTQTALFPWIVEHFAARLEAQRGRFDRAAAKVREARDKGMLSPGLIEADARFAKFRESEEWKALRAEFER